MNDFETLKETFIKIGIKFSDYEFTTKYKTGQEEDTYTKKVIKLENYRSYNNSLQSGQEFYFIFNDEGKFMRHNYV